VYSDDGEGKLEATESTVTVGTQGLNQGDHGLNLLAASHGVQARSGTQNAPLSPTTWAPDDAEVAGGGSAQVLRPRTGSQLVDVGTSESSALTSPSHSGITTPAGLEANTPVAADVSVQPTVVPGPTALNTCSTIGNSNPSTHTRGDEPMTTRPAGEELPLPRHRRGADGLSVTGPIGSSGAGQAAAAEAGNRARSPVPPWPAGYDDLPQGGPVEPPQGPSSTSTLHGAMSIPRLARVPSPLSSPDSSYGADIACEGGDSGEVHDIEVSPPHEMAPDSDWAAAVRGLQHFDAEACRRARRMVHAVPLGTTVRSLGMVPSLKERVQGRWKVRVRASWSA
jgi:hypothetical protein